MVRNERGNREGERTRDGEWKRRPEGRKRGRKRAEAPGPGNRVQGGRCTAPSQDLLPARHLGSASAPAK